MDQYLTIPFLGGWTFMNPSDFDVNRRGTFRAPFGQVSKKRLAWIVGCVEILVSQGQWHLKRLVWLVVLTLFLCVFLSCSIMFQLNMPGNHQPRMGLMARIPSFSMRSFPRQEAWSESCILTQSSEKTAFQPTTVVLVSLICWSVRESGHFSLWNQAPDYSWRKPCFKDVLTLVGHRWSR